MIHYHVGVDGLAEEQFADFFVGWPVRPGPDRFRRALRGSYRVVYATDGAGAVLGFATAISDGAMAAFIPMVEVRPDQQGRGIGSELVRRLLAELDHLYAVDLVCDVELTPFYARHGLRPLRGMVRRDRTRLS